MRFEGYQKVKFAKGIPTGWKVGRLSDLLDDGCIQTGKRPKGGAQDSGIPSVGAENVIGLGKYNFDKEKYVNEDFFNSMRHGHLADRDVLFYKDGAEIGRTTLFQDDFPHAKCCVNEHVFILRTEEKLWQYFLYFYLNQEAIKAYVKLINKNAAQPGINKTELKSLPLLVPPVKVVGLFNELVSPIIQMIFSLAKTELNLKQTRDLLLPRLISGKLSVENLELPSNEKLPTVTSAPPQHELAHA